MMIKPTLLSIFLVLFLLGCKKKNDDPVEPKIVFKSISATSVQQFNNALIVKFDYEDFQGDLGNKNPDILQLSVKDSRLTNADWYHIPPMTPDDKSLHIQGTYTLELRPLFLLGNGAAESTTLTIQIKDAAGNLSNAITTPAITITQ